MGKTTINKSKARIISRLEKEYKEELNGEKIDNIFKYVIPTTLFVPNDIKSRTVALLCDFKFDIEHGIAIVFENNKFKEICTQDGVL